MYVKCIFLVTPAGSSVGPGPVSRHAILTSDSCDHTSPGPAAPGRAETGEYWSRREESSSDQTTDTRLLLLDLEL